MGSHNRIRSRRILIVLIVLLTLVLICLLIVAVLLSQQGKNPAPGPDKDSSLSTSGTDTPGTSETHSSAAPGTDHRPGNEETGPSADATGSETETSESPPEQSTPPGPDSPVQPTVADVVSSGEITCDQYGAYSGQFVEDGRDELVENVAAILVTNRSDRFLDFAALSYEIDGKEAAFVLSGLPAGRSAWVLEATQMTVTQSSVFTYRDCMSSFRDGVIASTSKLTILPDGNMLTAVNNSSETLEDVFVYYRTLHTDGNFLGGITYRVDFGTLEPGASVEAMAGHYAESTSEIVRIGWRDG